MDQLEKHNRQGRNSIKYKSNWKITSVVLITWLAIIATTIILNTLIK